MFGRALLICTLIHTWKFLGMWVCCWSFGSGTRYIFSFFRNSNELFLSWKKIVPHIGIPLFCRLLICFAVPICDCFSLFIIMHGPNNWFHCFYFIHCFVDPSNIPGIPFGTSPMQYIRQQKYTAMNTYTNVERPFEEEGNCSSFTLFTVCSVVVARLFAAIFHNLQLAFFQYFLWLVLFSFSFSFSFSFDVPDQSTRCYFMIEWHAISISYYIHRNKWKIICNGDLAIIYVLLPTS